MCLLVWAPPATAGPAVDAVGVGVDAGYVFRSQVDGRNHGAGASLFVDVPLPGPFGLRPELTSLGFQGSVAAPSSLGFFAGSLSLVYSFDDSELEALASVGPLAGVSVDAPGAAFHAGALLAIGVRAPVAGAVSLDLEVSLPLVVYGPKGATAPGQQAYADGSLVELPLQALFGVGFVVDLEALFAGLAPEDG